MKVLILNSGMGSRMGVLTKEHPKCMTNLVGGETVLSRQLKIIKEAGLSDVVITTGYYDKVLVDYCESLKTGLNFTFVKNPVYSETNYIYSIYCAREVLDDDIVMMHGDLVFEKSVFEEVIKSERSCMTVSSTLPLPEKDFKAVIDGDRIKAVGVEFFESALAAQPLYLIKREDWKIWLSRIADFCESDNRKCYAEKAFNEVSDNCKIYTFDFMDRLCAEVDTPEDLATVVKMIKD